METYFCSIGGEKLDAGDAYEYRGAYACEEHFELAQEKRDHERAEIIEEESHKLAPLKGLDFGDSTIGRANHKILKPQIEIARKESGRIKAYETPNT